jgi:hypothetical protein
MVCGIMYYKGGPRKYMCAIMVHEAHYSHMVIIGDDFLNTLQSFLHVADESFLYFLMLCQVLWSECIVGRSEPTAANNRLTIHKNPVMTHHYG